MKDLISIFVGLLIGIPAGIAFDLADKIAEDRDAEMVQSLTEMRVEREWQLEREGK